MAPGLVAYAAMLARGIRRSEKKALAQSANFETKLPCGQNEEALKPPAEPMPCSL
jgi:hypothetical protein